MDGPGEEIRQNVLFCRAEFGNLVMRKMRERSWEGSKGETKVGEGREKKRIYLNLLK